MTCACARASCDWASGDWGWVRSASATALMCVGVVPQQPPTRVTPASAKRVRYREKYPPSMANSNERGPVLRGCPAFGWALTGTAEYRTRSSATTSIRCGPIVQLVPIIATGSEDSTAATSRGVSPPRVCASSANVACAISGRLVTDAATETASTSSSR